MARDLIALLAELELEEKAALLAGADLWSTVAIERVGLPSVRVTDGPNGARGPALPAAMNDRTPLRSACVPCGAALGATWDQDLIERVGAMLGQEARTKASRVLLAPTVNLHRSPLGGRNFESYSEDPLLAGRIGAAFIRGAQSEGVACTVKHFAGNEAETDRMVADTIVDERTLRELYLVPFELAVREAGVLGVMTSYNRLNGEYCADSHRLLAEILRSEWRFEGFVLSDWFAVVDTGKAIVAGLDLEMPGPGRAYGEALEAAVRDGVVTEAAVDEAVLRLLGTFDRIGALDDDPDEEPTSDDRPEHRVIAREAAVAATVLLKNDAVLPLDAGGLRRVAVIGPNAGRAVIMGGGSASFACHYLRSPLEALRDRLGSEIEVVHEPGVDIARTTPVVPGELLQADGQPGMAIEFFADGDLGGEVVHTSRAEDGSLVGFDRPSQEAADSYAWRATAELTVPTDGHWLLSLVETVPAKVLVDGVVVLDGFEQTPEPSTDLFGRALGELFATIELRRDRPVHVEIQSTVSSSRRLTGAKLCLRPAVADDGVARAVAAAADADAVIIVVGTDGDWESEGHDRRTMDLPGDQDDLIARVLDVAPDAVVVVNAGAPVAMPWADDAKAVLQVWFGGQEMADGLVDVLLGDAEPGGRLPTTIPRRLEDNPSFGNFPPEAARISYGEGVLVGYRWYESRRIDVSFPFGHGLSYTSFQIGEPELSSSTFEVGAPITVRVPVTNVGERAGTEVVQLYVAPPSSRVFRPRKELRAFVKVALAPGASETVRFELDARAFARWAAVEPGLEDVVAELIERRPWSKPPSGMEQRGWTVDAGRYELHLGRSSADVSHVVAVDVLLAGAAPS